jgi:hypothetical protein
MLEKVLSPNLPVDLSAGAKTLIFTGVSLLAFVVPFFLGQPQWLVGTIVNSSLFLSALFC